MSTRSNFGNVKVSDLWWRKLSSCYQKISKCPVVVNRSLEKKYVQQFERLLNEVQKLPERDVIRALYKINPDAIMSLIYNNKNHMEPLILFTESKKIVSYFGIRKLIYISWDRENNVYNVDWHTNVKKTLFHPLASDLDDNDSEPINQNDNLTSSNEEKKHNNRKKKQFKDVKKFWKEKNKEGDAEPLIAPPADNQSS